MQRCGNCRGNVRRFIMTDEQRPMEPLPGLDSGIAIKSEVRYVPPPPPLHAARVTVTQTVTHMTRERQVSWESMFGRMISTEEQPFVRNSKVGEQWMPLETGWLKDCSCLVLVNEEGKLGDTYPTLEEKKVTAAKVIELGWAEDTACWLVPPGESFRGSPADLGKLRIRCQRGEAKYTLVLVPK
jgi:hypothetical protein